METYAIEATGIVSLTFTRSLERLEALGVYRDGPVWEDRT